MTVYDTDTNPTANPRAQLEPAVSFVDGDEFWWGFGLYLPASWPALPSGGWLTLAEVYGPPHDGPAPLRICVEHGYGAETLALVRSADTGNDAPWSTPIVRSQWTDIAMRTKLSTSAATGYVELWVNSGTGWRRQALNGQARLMTATLGTSNATGPNRPDIKLYRKVGMFDEMTCYFASHRVGTTLGSVDPRSH